MSLLITVGLCSGFCVLSAEVQEVAAAVSPGSGSVWALWAHLRAALCTCLSESPRFAASSDFLLIVMYLLQ